MTEERSDEAVRGGCQHCLRSVQLRKDGTLWHHGGVASGYDRWVRCHGSGREPLATETRGNRNE